MERIGTVSSAAGFIFLGIWTIINGLNSSLGDKVFKWWPFIIILLGIEIVIAYKRKVENRRIKFNFLIGIIILLFMCTNIIKDLRSSIDLGMSWLNNRKNDNVVSNDIKYKNYILKHLDKNFSIEGNNFEFYADNADITIKKSKGSNLSIEGDEYFDKEYKQDDYIYEGQKLQDGYKVQIKGNEIKELDIKIYIPDGCNIKIEGDNLKVQNEDALPLSQFNIKGNRGSVKLNSAYKLISEYDKGTFNLKDIGSIDIKNDNGKIIIRGNSDNININNKNSDIEIQNELCKNVNINSIAGIIRLNTLNRDLVVNLNVDSGVAYLDNLNRINGGISKTIGEGNGKVNVKLNNGTIIMNTRQERFIP